jgi:hypothetical protein
MSLFLFLTTVIQIYVQISDNVFSNIVWVYWILYPSTFYLLEVYLYIPSVSYVTTTKRKTESSKARDADTILKAVTLS